MTSYVITFAVPYYDLDKYTASDTVARVKRIEGVSDARMYEITDAPVPPVLTSKVQKTPRFRMEIEVAEEAPMLIKVLDGLFLENQEYVSDVQLRVYKQLA